MVIATGSAEEKKAAMNAAGETAKEDFNSILEGMSPKQREGAELFVDWIRVHYQATGYRRLCRFALWEVFPANSN